MIPRKKFYAGYEDENGNIYIVTEYHRFDGVSGGSVASPHLPCGLAYRTYEQAEAAARDTGRGRTWFVVESRWEPTRDQAMNAIERRLGATFPSVVAIVRPDFNR